MGKAGSWLKAVAKSVFFSAFYNLGAFRLLRLWNNLRGKTITVATFHRVADRADDDTSSLPTLFISRENFRRTCGFLARRYNIISINDLAGLLGAGRKVPSNTLLVTFDDGYRDIFENALPVLAEKKIPSVVFLPTAFPGAGRAFWWDRAYHLMTALSGRPECLRKAAGGAVNDGLRAKVEACLSVGASSQDLNGLISSLQLFPHDDVVKLMDRLSEAAGSPGHDPAGKNQAASWAEIRGASGPVAYGSHTRTHLFLSSADPPTVRSELSLSRKEIEDNLGAKVIAFAYPGGRVTGMVSEAVKEAGYTMAFTTDPGINSPSDDRLLLKRINIWDGTVCARPNRFSEAKLAFNLLGYARQRNSYGKTGLDCSR